MGIDLVKFIVARCGPLKLSGNAYKVLVAMAATSLDQPNDKGQPERLYFAGWGPLALALGFDLDEQPAKAKEAVRKALKELREKGVVETTVDHARTGHAQCYRLNLTLASSLVHWSPKARDQKDPRSGAHVVPQLGGDWSPDSGAPRTNTGAIEDSSKDSISHPSASTTGRARETEPEIKIGRHAYSAGKWGLACGVCKLPEAHPRHGGRRVA